MNVKINPMHLIMTILAALEESKGVHKILDEDGNMVVPINRFGDFCHDLGIILGRSIEKVAEVEEDEEE